MYKELFLDAFPFVSLWISNHRVLSSKWKRLEDLRKSRLIQLRSDIVQKWHHVTWLEQVSRAYSYIVLWDNIMFSMMRSSSIFTITEEDEVDILTIGPVLL